MGDTNVLACELFTFAFCPWLKSVPNNSTRNNQRSGKCVRPKAIRGEERELTCVVLLLAIRLGVRTNKLI